MTDGTHKPTAPSILLFMVDQLSAKWIEDAAARAIPTPNLDRLRARGVTFRNAISSNPVCCPARATLATGLTSRQHGVLQNGYRLDPGLPTFMRILQQAGWRTGAFGKVHFHPHFAGVHPDYRPYGFDVTRITEDPRAGEWLDWLMAEHPEHVDAALATIWCSEIPELRAYGEDRVDLGTRIRALRARAEWSTPEFPRGTWHRFTLPYPEPLSQTAWITRHAMDFLREQDPRQPFLAQVSYVQPHGPSCPPADAMRAVDPDRLPAPVPPEWPEDPRRPRCFDRLSAAQRRVPGDWRERRHYYFADIVHLDRQLGELLDTLAEAGRRENTYVIVLSDHGDMLCDHGLLGKGEFHYDACIRVPLVVAGPGLQSGAECDAPVQLEDVFPTILEMTQQPLPDLPVSGPYLRERPDRVPGRSLLPLCRGEPVAGWRDAAYVESYDNITSCSPRHWARTIRTREFRYTWYPYGAGEQLFSLVEDPDETRNLSADPSYADVRHALRDRLLEQVVLQDYPHPRRGLFALGVH